MAKPFPWAEVMTLGLGRLRLAPEAFWNLTPREFAILARSAGLDHQDRPGRDDLDALMRAFPDMKGTDNGR